MQQTESFVIFSHSLPFQPPDHMENQNLKLKKTTQDIIISHICTINDNHTMYVGWFLRYGKQQTEYHSEQFFLSFDTSVPKMTIK